MIYLCMMKKLIPLFAFFVATITGCRQFDKLTQFEMPYTETVVIPASTGINLPFNLFSPDVETNSEATFAINDTRKDLVEEIRLTSLAVEHQSPAGEDFSFLKSVRIYISAEGLTEVQIAWKENIPDTAGTLISLDVSGDDLKEYIKKDKFTLRVNTVTDEFLTADHEVKIHSVFFVDAKILGQ